MPGAPARYGTAFLEWFKAETERAWTCAQPPTLTDYQARRVGGVDWQTGTRWLPGLSEEEIDAIERREGVPLAADFRLYLRHLRGTDRPRVGARFDGATLVPTQRPGFYDWKDGLREIEAARDNVLEGLVFDVEHNGLWLDELGEKPPEPGARREALAAAVAAAPRLLPLFEHRALVAQPPRVGNPVLSIMQSDLIIYGEDLRAYLLNELGAMIGVEREPVTRAPELEFWGQFL